MRITIVIEGTETGAEAPSVQVLHSAGMELAQGSQGQDLDAGPAPGPSGGTTAASGPATITYAPGMASSMAVSTAGGASGTAADAGPASASPGSQAYPAAASGQAEQGGMQWTDAGPAPRPGQAMPPPASTPAQTGDEPAAGKSKRKRARKAT